VPGRIEFPVNKDPEMAWGFGGLKAQLGIEAKQIL
jgi:hypothetical protein